MMTMGTLTTQNILIQINALGSGSLDETVVLMQLDLPEFLIFIRASEIRNRSASISLVPVNIRYDLQNGCTQTCRYEETDKTVGFCLVNIHHKDI